MITKTDSLTKAKFGKKESINREKLYKDMIKKLYYEEDSCLNGYKENIYFLSSLEINESFQENNAN